MLNRQKYTNIIFNNSSSLELGLLVTELITIPSTAKILQEDYIPLKGTVIEETEEYEDIEIEVPFNYLEDDKNFNERLVRKWLFNITDRYLRLSKDANYLYKVKKVIKTPTTHDFYKGEFTVTFLCEGLQYTDESLIEIELSNNSMIVNNGDVTSKPIIVIKGEGLIKLNVNDEEITVNVGQELTINSELELCYKSTEEWKNSTMKGDFPVLKMGENYISWTGNVNSLSIVTNTRYV